MLRILKNMIFPLELTLNYLQRAYASGDIQPADVLSEICQRIEQHSDKNIWIQALDLSEMLTWLKRANPNGPLYGIPFAIKDNIDLQGVPSTAGCKAYSYIPDRSATVVTALLQAGAIPVGKTNMDQFATGLVGTRSPYGICQNSRHPEAISGGSSSGSAVAVALGMASFSLGTDTAGSGRVPAALNGIMGYKPTPGLVSMSGVIPACRSLDTVSLFYRDVKEADTIFPIMIQNDKTDPLQKVQLQPARARCPRYATLSKSQAIWFGRGEYADEFDKSLSSLMAQGVQIEEVDLKVFFDVAKMLYQGPWVAERFDGVGEFIKQHPDAADPTVSEIILGGESITGAETFHAMTELAHRTSKALELFETFDGLILPTIGGWFSREDVAADPIGSNSALGTYTNFANLLGLSACSFPIGEKSTPDTPPFGLTLFGPGGQDLTTIQRAHDLEKRCQWIPLAVCGAHLKGLPLNHQLLHLGAVYDQTISTAPHYKFVAISEQKPGLFRVLDQGTEIELEVWLLPQQQWGAFVPLIPSPLGIGKIELSDGTWISGFLGEAHLLESYPDISAFRSWRAYLSQ
jgi:allophanate hydrolase